MSNQVSEFLLKLEQHGFLDSAQTRNLAAQFNNQSRSLLQHLSKRHLVPLKDLARLWGDQIGIPWVDLSKSLFQAAALAKLSKDFCASHSCIPLYIMADIITVAMEDPHNLITIEDAEKVSGCKVSPVFATGAEIEDALTIQYNSLETVDHLLEKIDLSEFAETGRDNVVPLNRITNNDSIIVLTRTILLWGIKERASDIHIEPAEFEGVIRFRVDGIMQKRMELKRELLAPLTARLKVLANVDVTEKRKPQDGRINLQLKNGVFDFRFSCVPTIYGERAVLRILGQINKHEVPSLDEINLTRKHYTTLSRMIHSPSGIFIVTGPTGSGKSTTLFSMLKGLDRNSLNIMTVENPVEYRLAGITQIEVNAAIGLDFAKVLRSLLRQDPDVILVGEIRDAESAKVAAEAALTGHFVMSTLHTNGAIQAVTRLVEIGVEPFLVAPAIIGVTAQRLVRKLCAHCRVKYRLPEEDMHRIFEAAQGSEVFFYRALGCPECNNTGYQGRLAIHEVLMVNDDVRSLISRDASILEIQELVLDQGFETMRYDGLKKAMRGLTTLEEVDRVTVGD